MIKTDPITGHILPANAFKIIDEALVDDVQWYTVHTHLTSIMLWIRGNNKDLWWQHPSSRVPGMIFDVHKNLYVMLALRWSDYGYS
jgi:hypothetical protein